MAIVDMTSFQMLLVSLTVLFIYWMWMKTKGDYLTHNIPPFPVRPWPFVGHFFLLFGNFRGKLKEWRERSGSIYSLDTAGRLNILVNDFKDIKEVWVKYADHIVNVQHSFGDELLDEYNTGITAARDENWKEQRTTSLAILRNFGMGKNLMAEKIQTEVGVVVDKLAALNGQPINVRVLLNVAVANIISSVCIGKRMEYDDPYFIQLIEPLGVLVKYFATMMLLEPFKQICSIPGDLFKSKKWTNAAIKVNEIYSKPYITKFKQEFNENEEPNNFISAYLKEMKRLEDKGAKTNISEKNLVTIVRTLFAAGTETSSTTILWCFLYMLHNPEVQEKVFNEIDTVVGTERTPNMNDKSKLIYLNAVIRETQRRASLVPIGLKREVSQTFEYGGYTFPKGCVIWPVLDSVHYDQQIWPDPYKFRPERFISENGTLVNREELIPFSIGRRICLGEPLAKMELFLFLSAIFQRFRLEPVDKSCLPPLKENFGMTVIPVDYHLKFVDRKAL